MYMQQVVQPRSSSDEYGRHNIGSDTATRFDSKGEFLQSNSRDRLIYLTTCLVGHQVEVQVQDGSVFSGIFHATNAEDFGIVLKMANSIKDGTQGQKNISDFHTKPPSRTLIIPAKDLVQVIAKGVPVTRNGFMNELEHEKQPELMIDSYISQSRKVEVGRELERWVPDENDPGCPELENIFDGSWNRGWDQFEVNETLFGVKSTFNEELYTTRLQRGPQMRDLEREALRLAREIKGEVTHDLHLAEERGVLPDGSIEMDEETLYSSVYRGTDEDGYSEIEDILLDARNDDTFGGVSDSIIDKNCIDMSTRKNCDGTQVSWRSSLMGERQSSLTATIRDVHYSGFEDHAAKLPKHSSVIDASRVHDDKFIGHPVSNYLKKDKEKQKLHDQSLVSKPEDSQSLLSSKKESWDKVGLSANATAFDPSHVSSKDQEISSSCNEAQEATEPPKTQGTASSPAQSSSHASSTSDRGGAPSTSAGRGLSPSLTVSSLASEKSTLNPHAKEFKLSAKAKSFVPSPTPLRPSSPVPDSSFYYPDSMTAATHMHGVPVGVEIGPSFAVQQPVLFSPQGVPMPHPYYHPNGPQMMMGQPGPGLYMPTYPPEMQYK